MKITEDIVKNIILEVLKEMQEADGKSVQKPPTASSLHFQERGEAQIGIDKKEVVIGIPPAFGTAMTQTIINIPHGSVLKEIMAGIEEEGLKARLVRVHRTADVGFISHEAAKLSGSGIGIGTNSRGTTVIHQRDLSLRCRIWNCFPNPRWWNWKPSEQSVGTPPNTLRAKTLRQCRCAMIQWRVQGTRDWRRYFTTKKRSWSNKICRPRK